MQNKKERGAVWAMLVLLLAFDLIVLFGYSFCFIRQINPLTMDAKDSHKLLQFFITFGLILLVIIILRYGHGKILIFGCVFAALPLVFSFALITGKVHLVIKREQSQAMRYYHQPLQQDIALAIEYGDAELLEELLLTAKGAGKIGKSGNISSYMQFAVKVYCLERKQTKPFEKILKILLKSGIPANDALISDCNCLSPESIALLLDFGMNPNVFDCDGKDPLVFDLAGKGDKENALVLLLLKKGVDIDVRNSKGQTIIMVVAELAAAFPARQNNWKLVYKLLELRANFTCTAIDGSTLGSIMRATRVNAALKKQSMPTDFSLVQQWMTDHHYVDVPF